MLAGNLTELSVTAITITPSWQVFFGNVSGDIVLDDASGSSLYAWVNENPQGEIYATRALDVNFASVNCTTLGQVGSEETALGQSSTDTDSVRNTFNASSHPTSL